MHKTVPLRAYWSLFRIKLIESVQYRLAAVSGASISAFWGIIEIVVLSVFYTHSAGAVASVNGLSLAQAVTYTWIAQAVMGFVGPGIDGEIREKITSGNVGIELCRPIGLYGHWFARSAASRLGGAWLRGLLTAAVGLVMPLAMRMRLPASPASFALFCVSTVSAFLLCNAYGMLATSLRLGISWGEGPSHMIILIAQIFSGAYLPLPLWPDALQPFLRFQPFAGTLDVPARLYVGQLPPEEAALPILMQLAWTAAFMLAGRLIIRRKLASLVIQGG